MNEPTLKISQPSETLVPRPPQRSGRGPAWIDSATAANRAGMNIGAVNRLCGDRWLAQGLAELRKPEGGGKARWFVREDADARFTAIKFPDQMSAAFDMSALTAAQRDETIRRERIVQAWDRACAGGVALGLNKERATQQFLTVMEHAGIVVNGDQLVRPCVLSRGTLYNWNSRWRAEGRKGLVDGRAKTSDQAANEQADEFRRCLIDLYLHPNKRSKTLCYEIAATIGAERGWTIPGNRTARRWLEELPAAVLTKMRDGDKAFVDKHEPHTDRDYSTINTNDIWSGDDHTFDVMVVDPRGPAPDGKPRFLRPILSGWQDMRSRKLVAWKILPDSPNADTILQTMALGIRTAGKPHKVSVDNGKHYDARKIQGISKLERYTAADMQRMNGAFNHLGITIRHAKKFHGQSKSIERNFGTICSRFSKLWDTYCGKDVLSKPETLKGALASGKAPTLEEFTTAFTAWVENDYHNRAHLGDSMDGRTPAEVFDACLLEKIVVPDDLLTFVCMPAEGLLNAKGKGGIRIGQHGVTWKGLHYGRYNPELQRRHGERVTLKIDVANVGRVLVCDMDGRLITAATLNQKLSHNATAEELAEAHREKKKLRNTLKQYTASRPRMGHDVHALLNSPVTPASKPSPTEPPAPLKHHRTRFDDQFAAIQQAVGSKPQIAVGAESIDPRVWDETFAHSAAQDEVADTFGILSQAIDKPRRE